ncbi:putative mitochondrial protein [Andalucia godoyi]|uniref:Putative mitochondrial protein n=1 Tax=Andalucia godoyi TaxID=505711 RepID=A0A8K0F469_ANDGO|nr:putative mitochondrial protein [Andalucia godoyi]|eukprot:ANDGO_08435.mRNA.1 putative mitochondrial protein
MLPRSFAGSSDLRFKLSRKIFESASASASSLLDRDSSSSSSSSPPPLLPGSPVRYAIEKNAHDEDSERNQSRHRTPKPSASVSAQKPVVHSRKRQRGNAYSEAQQLNNNRDGDDDDDGDHDDDGADEDGDGNNDDDNNDDDDDDDDDDGEEKEDRADRGKKILNNNKRRVGQSPPGKKKAAGSAPAAKIVPVVSRRRNGHAGEGSANANANGNGNDGDDDDDNDEEDDDDDDDEMDDVDAEEQEENFRTGELVLKKKNRKYIPTQDELITNEALVTNVRGYRAKMAAAEGGVDEDEEAARRLEAKRKRRMMEEKRMELQRTQTIERLLQRSQKSTQKGRKKETDITESMTAAAKSAEIIEQEQQLKDRKSAIVAQGELKPGYFRYIDSRDKTVLVLPIPDAPPSVDYAES